MSDDDTRTEKQKEWDAMKASDPRRKRLLDKAAAREVDKLKGALIVGLSRMRPQ